MTDRDQSAGWAALKRKERGRRALERQLDYQEEKAAGISAEEDLVRQNFIRAQQVRKVIERVQPVRPTDRVLEVGSGAHGLVFSIGECIGVGIDPLAVDYRRLFPRMQSTAATVAAIGEELPFDDESFDVVMSDNVIDHAERPLEIIDEIVRVLKPGGTLFFTVNVHHPIYSLASDLHGAWNALGIKLELSAFADHTIHLTEEQISAEFRKYPLKIYEQTSNVAEVRSAQRNSGRRDVDGILKRLFFKNAVFQLLAAKEDQTGVA